MSAQDDATLLNEGADTLVDIETLAFGPDLDPMDSFLAQVKNPYRFLCGDTPVRVSFSPEGKSLEECLGKYLARQE